MATNYMTSRYCIHEYKAYKISPCTRIKREEQLIAKTRLSDQTKHLQSILLDHLLLRLIVLNFHHEYLSQY